MSASYVHPASPARRSVKRPARPAPLTRRSTAQYRVRDLIPKASPVGVDQNTEGLHPLDMAASFLQHCAFCEKQIMHPSHNMLYCSQACRRKDANKPMSLPYTPTVSPSTTAPSSPRAILAASTPSGASYIDYPSTRIPADLHNTKSDLDPTEWKPKGMRDPRKSEAFRYLSQFHRHSSSTLDDHEKINMSRPYMHRNHASTNSMVTTPSLASTPTTATSSLSVDYDFNTRALPPRHNPMYPASASTTKNIDLVIPHMVPEIVGSVPTGESWTKQPVGKRAGREKDGLLSKSMGK